VENHPSDEDPNASEWRALLFVCLYATVLLLWGVWFISLYGAAALFFAFDSDVTGSEGLILGAIQATWVAAIPIGLLVLGHLIGNGWQWPVWRLRWILVAACAVAWIAILWYWLSITPYDASSQT
jgi:hypothetical protein